MIQTTCKLSVYTDDTKWLDEKLFIHSHWNRNEFVVLEFKGEKIAVTAKELKAAIDNCTNTTRF